MTITKFAFVRTALAPIGVDELQQWLDRDDTQFAIMTAYTAAPKSENVMRLGNLRSTLDEMGYSGKNVRRLRGQWFDETTGAESAEASYLVVGIPFEDAARLGRMFGQEAIIYKDTTNNVGMYWLGDNPRVTVPTTPEGQPLFGSATTDVALRQPKPERRGPPSEQDLWSKARNLSFSMKYDWDTPLDVPWSGEGVVSRQDVEQATGGGAAPRTAQQVELTNDEPYDEWTDEPEPGLPDEMTMPDVQPEEREHGFAVTDLAPDGGYGNIMRIMDMAAPEEVDFWANWYPIASRDTQQLAVDYGVPTEVAAGVAAVLSPQLKWEQNLAAAEAVLQRPEETRQLLQQRQEAVQEYGVPYAKLPKDVRQQLVIPGVPSYPANIQKALNIIEADDPMVGQTAGVKGPKVEVFYRAFMDPQGTSRDIVLDGHAINIWRGALDQPLEGIRLTDRERQQIIADYQRVADDFGIEPQEVQATTWSLWRAMKQWPTRPGTRMSLMCQLLDDRIDPDVVQLLADLHGISVEQVLELMDQQVEPRQAAAPPLDLGPWHRVAIAPAVWAAVRWLLTNPHAWQLLAEAYKHRADLKEYWDQFQSGEPSLQVVSDLVKRIGPDAVKTFMDADPGARNAARLRFEDEMQTNGELSLGAVQPGDRVRFDADISKPGWPRVDAGTLGTVRAVHDGQQLLEVEALANTAAAGGGAADVSPRTVLVGVDEVTAIVDSRDPRVSEYRIAARACTELGMPLDEFVRTI